MVLVLSATVLVHEGREMPEPTIDHERLGDDGLSIDDVAFSFGIAWKRAGCVSEGFVEYEYRVAEYELHVER